jgi:hypothetical protein
LIVFRWLVLQNARYHSQSIQRQQKNQIELYMVDFEEVTVKLQSGADVVVQAWQGSDTAQPLVIVAPRTTTGDWAEFVSFLAPTHSPLLADVTSAHELLMLIWEIGEPVQLLAQGNLATDIAGETVNTAQGAISSMIVCDGQISPRHYSGVQSISTLILLGRQSDLLSHEDAVQMHDALRHSTLIESENTGSFPAKNNADAAASAVNWFNSGAGNDEAKFGNTEPIDPKG